MNNIGEMLTKPEFYIPFLIWTMFWKGWALWKAANKRQLWWFAGLLVVNTMSILEIAYIFFLNRWDIDNGKTLRFLEKRIKKSSQR